MELAEYVRYQELLGSKVVWLDGIPFAEYRRRVYWSLPRWRQYDIGRAAVRRLLVRGALVAVAVTSESTPRGVSFCVCRGPDFGFHRLHRKKRNQTRRGLEACEVRRVGWDEMRARGLQINREALRRQGRRSPLGDARWWDRQCRVSAEFADVWAWGAYVGDDLAAYVHVITHSAGFEPGEPPVADVIHFMSGDKHLRSYPNEALIFTVTTDLLALGYERVVLGSGSDDENLLPWKRHMGYTVASCSYHLAANPMVHVVKPFVPKLRMWMDGSMLGVTRDTVRT